MGPVKHNILVVIPDKGLMELVSRIMEDMGHRPLKTPDEVAYHKILEENPPIALLVGDWELLLKHAPRILKDFHTRYPHAGRFMLTLEQDFKVRQFIEEGLFCCYIKKPFALADFESGIEDCIKKRE